ncbi:hypothetical protein INR49_011590 [Caranx melampygus]|nr:hypothetical protein INR49_011590 [Caranx melampygus]
MISELSSISSLLIGCPSRLGISTRPSSRSFPACSLRSAVTMAAFGTGCVMLGLSRICSRLRMCLFTASRKSTFSRPDSGTRRYPGRRVRLRLGPGRSGAADGEDASHEECQPEKTATHFLSEEEKKKFFPLVSKLQSVVTQQPVSGGNNAPLWSGSLRTVNVSPHMEDGASMKSSYKWEHIVWTFILWSQVAQRETGWFHLVTVCVPESK